MNTPINSAALPPMAGSVCVICGCEPAFPQPADKPYVCYSCGITGERSCEGCSLNDYCPMPYQKPKAFGCPLYLPNDPTQERAAQKAHSSTD